MIKIKQTEEFSVWLTGLKDSRTKATITSRVARLSGGLLGDVKPVGGGISELRVHFGAGYRVYIQQRGNTLIILLCGGSKRTQKRDIEKAKALAKQWENDNDNDKIN